jgi:hypothetical protein
MRMPHFRTVLLPRCPAVDRLRVYKKSRWTGIAYVPLRVSACMGSKSGVSALDPWPERGGRVIVDLGIREWCRRFGGREIDKPFSSSSPGDNKFPRARVDLSLADLGAFGKQRILDKKSALYDGAEQAWRARRPGQRTSTSCRPTASCCCGLTSGQGACAAPIPALTSGWPCAALSFFGHCSGNGRMPSSHRIRSLNGRSAVLDSHCSFCRAHSATNSKPPVTRLAFAGDCWMID